MKLAAALALVSGQYIPYPTTAERSPCRVAVSISGDVRSFVDPAVHGSFRRNVVEAIEADGCSVDVFAYASLGDEELLEEQEASMIRKIENTIEFLSPTQLVWHQEQAGIIPNSCRTTATTTTAGGGDEASSTSFAKSYAARHGGEHRMNKQRERARKSTAKPPSREQFSTRSERFYWQLYETLAAYRLVVQRETDEAKESPTIPSSSSASSKYDWIVATRFDIAWIKPLPSIRSFSRNVVWFAAKSWPMSDNFALVPRAFSDRFLSAVEAFHACDDGNGPSWPPQEAWWKPECEGSGNRNGSGDENLYDSDRDGSSGVTRDFEMDDGDDGIFFRDGRGGNGGEGFGESIVYRHLHASRVPHRPYPMFEYYAVPPYANDGDATGGDIESRCDAGKADFSTACTLLSSAGMLAPSHFIGNCVTALSEGSSLRCQALMHSTGMGHQKTERVEEILNEDPGAWREASFGTPVDEAEEQESGVFVAAKASRVREKDLARAWSNLVALRKAILLDAVVGGENIIRDSGTLAEEAPRGETSRRQRHLGEAQDSDNWEPKPLETTTTKDTTHTWTMHSQKGCRIDEYPGLAPHVIRRYSTDGYLMRELALATKCFAHRLMAGARAGSSATKDFEFGATLCAARRSLELVMIDVSLHSEELGICTADGSMGLTAQEHVQQFFADPAAHCVGYGRLVLRSPPLCPKLLVKAMEVMHPKQGAVYWEGPVRVELEVTLTGPGSEGLDLKNVHICADTDISWPVRDRSRSCVTLEELASSDQPSLVFGSTIGVIEGSVSLRDARPACIPAGELHGPVLAMEESRQLDDEGHILPQELASKSLRFKVIHHNSMLRRRGRPLAPAPLGRGFSTTQEYVQDLEREAAEEFGTAMHATESYLNLTHGQVVVAGSESCTSRLNLDDRATSLVASTFELGFHIDQLEWMVSNGKLPPEMSFTADRLREVQALFPDDSAPERVLCLGNSWQYVGSFFQKALVLPAPSMENVVSVDPLQTWEYDEIPWMEALNPNVDWNDVEEAYLGNRSVQITHVDGFFSQKALDALLDLAHGSSIFVDNRNNYLGAYPGDGMSHPLLYQIAEEAAERLPRILGRETSGWPLIQTWFYIYGGNDGERCTRGIRVHADVATVNLNIWLTDDSANLGSAETDDGGGLTVFHAKPPDDWGFSEFNKNPDAIQAFLEESNAGNTSVPHRQNRALLFNSMLFHQSDPFRFKKGFQNRRLNLTLLFGAKETTLKKTAAGNKEVGGVGKFEQHHPEMRTVPPREADQLRYCL